MSTTRLFPGSHTFTTKITSFFGQAASETVVANVVAAPAPPAELAGAWERVITPEDFQTVGLTTANAPILVDLLGRPWRLVFDEASVWVLDPEPGGGLEDVRFQGNKLSIIEAVRIVL